MSDSKEIIEPDKKFQGKLIDRWDEVGTFLYASPLTISPNITVRKAMMSFINRLPNRERHTVLKEIYDALNEGRVGKKTPLFSANRGKYYESYMEVYGLVGDYLGETYFKSYRVATPKYKGDKHLTVPKKTPS